LHDLFAQELFCEMGKDKRYGIVKKLIISGYITTFSEVLEVLPKTVLSRDLKIHHQTFDKLIEDLEKFTLKNIYRLALLIGVDKWEFVKLFINESAPAKKVKRKKRKTHAQTAHHAAKKE